VTPEEQQIAIAEACGWTKIGWNGVYQNWLGVSLSEERDKHPIPDYLNDLNAMHEAEIGIEPPTFKKYSSVLIADVIGWSAYNNEHIAIRATAAQRAEAFLKTLNLWKP
jgi:hypothetical protein